MLLRHLLATGLLLCAVAPVSTLAQKTIMVPSPGITTIQQGIDAASTGDTVLVAPGTYSEDLVIDGKEITLTSQGGPSQTFLVGKNDGYSPLFIHNTPSLATTISGFTFNAPYILSSACAGDDEGIVVVSAGATILRNVFINTFNAVGVDQGAITFEQNTAYVGQTFTGPCAAPGDGVFVGRDGSTISSGLSMTTITGNTFIANITAGYGVEAQYSGPITIDHNTFSGTTIGIVLEEVDSQVVIENNLITNGFNGAVEVEHTDDDPPSGPANTFILNNTFYNNLTAAGGPQPGATTYPAAEVKVTGTYSRVTLAGNIISTNSIADPILTCDPSGTTQYGPPTPIIVDHNLFWNPEGAVSDTTCPVPIGKFGNVNVNPQFVSSSDFHLSATSPAIDAGTSGTGLLQSTDLDGNPRVQDGSGKGYPIVDMGAYEFSGKPDADATSLVLTSSDYYLRSGNSLTLNAQLSDSTQGAILSGEPVSFYVDGGSPIVVNTDASGNASLPVNGLPLGLHTFTAETPGFALSTTHSVAPATAVVLYVYVVYGSPYLTTTLTLTSSLNPSNVGAPVTLSIDSISSDFTNPGPVDLYDGGTLLATLTPNIQGKAAYTTNSLSVGSHTLTATYTTDGVHESASASLTQVVQPPADFSLSSSVPSVTIQTEHHGTLTIAVSSISGFAGTVQLSCGALPEYASCTFANSALQLGANSTASTALTIDTDAVHDFAAADAHCAWQFKAVFALACPLFLIGLRDGKRTRLPPMLAAILLLPAVLWISGCSSLYPGHTPPGTYTISVNGNAVINGVTTTHTVNITLIVTP